VHGRGLLIHTDDVRKYVVYDYFRREIAAGSKDSYSAKNRETIRVPMEGKEITIQKASKRHSGNSPDSSGLERIREDSRNVVEKWAKTWLERSRIKAGAFLYDLMSRTRQHHLRENRTER